MTTKKEIATAIIQPHDDRKNSTSFDRLRMNGLGFATGLIEGDSEES